MTLHQLHLVCFSAGSIVHATQAVLVFNRWKLTSGVERRNAWFGVLICVLGFFWQFGNFWREFFQTIDFDPEHPAWIFGTQMRSVALVLFPLLFSYMIHNVTSASSIVRGVGKLSRGLRYVMWPWTILALAVLLNVHVPFVDEDFVEETTLHMMLVFFLMFGVEAAGEHRVHREGKAVRRRATRATLVASSIAAGIFIIMLFLSGGQTLSRYDLYFQLAAMMTSVPFTIAIGYQLYHFPFMDAFVRESISGIALLAGFAIAVAIGNVWGSQDLFIFWLIVVGVALSYAKPPLSRWVERMWMGYKESIEDQEERVGNAIRALTRLDQFSARVSEILASELEAEWVDVAPQAREDAKHRFEVPGPTSMWLSLGPRVGGRHYMSRHLRLARTAALQLAAHHHQLSQHELRGLTARAQMRALQAQINPHFLFNTLNVLANLIHTNPAKAERLTEELADIFRYALESTRAEWVKLDDELHFIEAYLEIEKARFEERLSYSFDIDPSARALRIPPMILQPLVENAIKHGISPKIEGGSVYVRGTWNGNELVLIVEDTGIGHLAKSRHRGSGIGLANVRERLHHMFGSAAVLRLEEIQPSGTRATLVLPQLVEVHS